jgi:regulator of RNase E activity RraA
MTHGEGSAAMKNKDVSQAFESLSTPLVFDACLGSGVEIRCAPPGLTPLAPHMTVAGRVLPARHAGSVDVFLEAFERAEQGDVLVIDNQGRRDEGCIGDLVALEARAAGVAGILLHLAPPPR